MLHEMLYSKSLFDPSIHKNVVHGYTHNLKMNAERKVIQMNWKNWLENWDMTSLKINLNFLEMEWNPNDYDKDAAWELYVELVTRITTQPLATAAGHEETALKSIYNLFPLTREALKRHGRHCNEFSRIAVVVLNQVVRPFTTRWHREVRDGGFEDSEKRRLFRQELEAIQNELRKYSKMLADMAQVEDLTNIEANER